MSKYVFLGRIKNCNDRDACAYIERREHRGIDGKIIIQGACYCGFEHEFREAIINDSFESILTKEELLDLLDNEGRQAIYMDKLLSDEAIEFKNKIMEDEHEMMKADYNLDDEDIERILDYYTLDYEDRAIICAIYEDTYELGEDWVDNCCNVEEWLKQYIDYEKMGEDILENEDYVELADGRIVRLSY